MDTLVKENVNSKRVLTKIVQEIWETMQRPNRGIVGIEKGDETQLRGPEKCQQNHRRKFP